MRRIVHISDLHFGRVNPALVEPLLAAIGRARPHVVAVSGDLTQRATVAEFAAARQFLDRIPFPKIVVPGNHDISLYDVYRRFARPLSRYRHHIDPEVEPSYADEKLLVAGVNTARSLTVKGGRISTEQIARLRERLCALGPHVFKVLVMHHPFIPPEGAKREEQVGRADRAMKELEHCGADLILAGHLHLGAAGQTSSFYPLARREILVVQSGTSLSARTRRERNSFNLIEVEPNEVSITIQVWEPDRAAFVPRAPARYEHRGRWRRIGEQRGGQELADASGEAGSAEGQKRAGGITGER